MRSSIQIISIFLIIISLLFGCNHENKVINAELEKNKSKWQESKISNYDFVIEYTNSSNVFVPILVKVKNGQADSEEPFREPIEYEKNETHENFNKKRITKNIW